MENETTSKTKIVSAIVVISLAFLPSTLAASSGAEEESANTAPSWQVPREGVFYLDEDTCIVASDVTIDGTIISQTDEYGNGATLSILASSFSMNGSFIGADGLDRANTTDLVAADGGHGSSLIVKADEITLGRDALVRTGAGGNGGVAMPLNSAAPDVIAGGSGGDGGAIILAGPLSALPAHGREGVGLYGNTGGHGGTAILPSNSTAASVIGGGGGHPGGLLTTDLSAPLQQPGGRPFAATSYATNVLQQSSIQSADPCETVMDIIGLLIEGGGEGVCNGTDGADVDTSGSPGTDAPDQQGTGSSGLLGGVGPTGQAGNDGNNAAGDARGGPGTDGCWGGNGGNGGNAYANGGSGGDGGDGGTGGAGTLIGGPGGSGGAGGNGKDAANAYPGKPGCGGLFGNDGTPGTGSANGGQAGFGGAGGGGGAGQLPGAPGSPGSTGSRGVQGVVTPPVGCNS